PLPVTLPVTDPKFAKYLERTNLLCWDAPRVKAALKEAVGDAKEPEAVVRKILRWIFVTLRKGSGPIPEPTAVEILEDGGGDCSESGRTWTTEGLAAKADEDPFSGLAFAKLPDGWTTKLSAFPGKGSVRGPGIRAELHVLSGYGDLSWDVFRQSMMQGMRHVQFAG